MTSIIVPRNINVIIHDRRYYSAIINDKQHVYSFLNKESATRCSRFLANFKHKYNKFPILEQKKFNKVDIKPVTINKRVPVDQILSNELYIQEMDISELQNKCSMFNIGLVGIVNFEYEFEPNNITLDFSLVDLLPDRVNQDECLETLFNEF